MVDLADELRTVLYTIFYVEDLSAFQGLTSSQKEAFLRDHTLEELGKMRDGLRWGVANSDYNFSSLWEGLSYTDQEILRYVEILLRDFEEFVPKLSRPPRPQPKL